MQLCADLTCVPAKNMADIISLRLNQILSICRSVLYREKQTSPGFHILRQKDHNGRIIPLVPILQLTTTILLYLRYGAYKKRVIWVVVWSCKTMFYIIPIQMVRLKQLMHMMVQSSGVIKQMVKYTQHHLFIKI